MAVYYDKVKDVYVMGWEDLDSTNTLADNDYNDNTFMMDTTGTRINAYNVPTACNPPCLNGGECNYATGICECVNGFVGPSCGRCTCDDGNPCTTDICNGPLNCSQSNYVQPLCTALQYCTNSGSCGPSTFRETIATQSSHITTGRILTVASETEIKKSTQEPLIITEEANSDALIGVAAGLAFAVTALILLVVVLVLRLRNPSGWSSQKDVK